MRGLKATGPRLVLFGAMVTWCKQRKIPARQWLYSLFAARRWMFAPKVEESALLSEKHLVRFKEFADYDFYAKYIKRIDNLKKLNDPKAGFDPNKDLSTTTEEAKRWYLSEYGATECRRHMFSETFGYHPLSRVCARCSGQTECLQELKDSLQFDVVGLRLGKLTVEDAKRKAFARITHG